MFNLLNVKSLPAKKHLDVNDRVHSIYWRIRILSIAKAVLSAINLNLILQKNPLPDRVK